MKKFKVYINNNFTESFRKLADAEAFVRMNERQDRYERDMCGYTNPLPVYEIRN